MTANVAATVIITGPGDLDDQRWLDRQVEAIETGVEAVVNIAHNWTDGRNLARLHPGVSAAEYVTARVGTLGKAVVPILLAQSNWSNRQIATVAGMSDMTVGRIARSGASDVAPALRPVLGADNKVYQPRTVTAVVIDTPTVRPAPLRKARAIPYWARLFTSWCRGARPEDRVFLRRIDHEVHAALDRNGIAREEEAVPAPPMPAARNWDRGSTRNRVIAEATRLRVSKGLATLDGMCAGLAGIRLDMALWAATPEDVEAWRSSIAAARASLLTLHRALTVAAEGVGPADDHHHDGGGGDDHDAGPAAAS